MTVRCTANWFCGLIAVVAVLVNGRSALGLTIALNFDAVNTELPAFDPDASKLQALAQDAAQLWEDLILDSGVVVITYRYRDVADLSNGTAISVSAEGRPKTGAINVDSSPRLWYFDTDPLNNSEFSMSQRLVAELSSAEVDQWYTGNPPDLLEASYRGVALSSAPDAARNGLDMFSTIIHEMGHVLGLSAAEMAFAETVGEGDFAFDVDAAMVGGAAMGIRTHGSNPNEVNDWSHLRAASLMCNACAAPGMRRLPSATDILAIASAGSWSQLDFSRQDFLSGSSWHEPENWLGNQVPDADDDAFLRAMTQVTIEADVEVGSLYIGEGSQLRVAEDSLEIVTQRFVNDGLLANGFGGGSGMPGRLDIIGDYWQGPGGSLEIVIGGAAAGEHDLLSVTGTATLAGQLSVTLVDLGDESDLFAPTAGQTFPIVSAAAGLSGEFDPHGLSLPLLSPGLGWKVDYGSNDVLLEIVTLTSLAADFNADGSVDSADLAIWQAAYGLTDGGDADDDGVTAGADFLVWQRLKGAAPALAVNSRAAVPELSTLVGLGWLFVLRLAPPSRLRRETPYPSRPPGLAH